MSRIDNPTRLRHMRDAAIEAMSFVENCTRKALDSDRMLTLALVKDIEIIGEAAGRISDSCKARYPQVPWLQMIGMRNRLTHAYFEIDHRTCLALALQLKLPVLTCDRIWATLTTGVTVNVIR